MTGNGIFWLASYPKSGNTWFRTFLTNFLRNTCEPASINELSTGQIGSSRDWLDDVSGFDSADLYQWEIDNLRPQIYDWTAKQPEKTGYHKIHDACWQLESGKLLIPDTATAGAIYFVRNPLDVAISFANHNHSSIDKAIMRMAQPEYCFCKNESNSLTKQTEQRLLTWSQHVTSWVDNTAINTHVVRYEDMKHQSLQTFTQAVDYLKLPHDHEKIARALRFSDFNVLKRQEAENKFCERPAGIARFFRKGIAGDWKETLTLKQIDQVISDHYEIMRRFGYLDDAGDPKVM